MPQSHRGATSSKDRPLEGPAHATNVTLAITVAQYNKLLIIAFISASGLPERLKLWHVSITIKALYNRTLRDLESTS